MAWSREILAAGSAQRAPGVVAPQPTEISPAQSRPPARKHVANQAAPLSHEMRRNRIIAPARVAAAARPATRQAARSNADRIGSPNKEMQTPNERQEKSPDSSKAESESTSKSEASSPSQPDRADGGKADASSTTQAEAISPLIHLTRNSWMYRALNKQRHPTAIPQKLQNRCREPYRLRTPAKRQYGSK